MNSFIFAAPLFCYLQHQHDRWSLALGRHLFLNWYRHNMLSNHANPLRWHDMATGIRAAYLAQQIAYETRGGRLPVRLERAYLELAKAHLEFLSDRKRLARYNHGLFQLIGVAALCEVLNGGRLVALRDWSRREFNRLLGEQFGPDGVHREHSPEYHLLVLRTARHVLESGLIGLSEEIAQRIQRAGAVLPWLIGPDGGLPWLGDTGPRSSPLLPRTDETARWRASGGKAGKRPPEGVACFSDGGYSVFRSMGAPGGESWLVVTTGHHSRFHKQADTFSFEWWDRGVQLIGDSGKWGYRRFHPNRRYVLSARAHNVVEAVGMGNGVRRTPVRPPRVQGAQEGGVVRFTMAGRNINGTIGVGHERVVLLRPGRWLLVVDRIESLVPWWFRQWFQLPADAVVSRRCPDGFVLRYPGSEDELSVRSLANGRRPTALRGRRWPRLNGWVSPDHGKFVPAWQIGFSTLMRRGYFVTLLSWLDGVDSDGAGECESPPSLEQAMLQWSTPDGRFRQSLDALIDHAPGIVPDPEP